MAYKFNQTFSVHTEYDWEGQHYSFDTPIPFQISVEVKDFKPMVSYCFKRYFDGVCSLCASAGEPHCHRL